MGEISQGRVVTEGISKFSLRLGLINHNVTVKFDEPPFHLKLAEEMCNCNSVALTLCHAGGGAFGPSLVFHLLLPE